MDDAVDALEMLRCSQINFDNFVKAYPSAALHPYYQIARMQLDEAVTAMEGGG